MILTGKATRAANSAEITVNGQTVPDSQNMGFGETASEGVYLVDESGIIYIPVQKESLEKNREILNKALDVITAVANEPAVVGKAPSANPTTAQALTELTQLIAEIKYE